MLAQRCAWIERGCAKTKVSETLLLLEGGVPEGGGGR